MANRPPRAPPPLNPPAHIYEYVHEYPRTSCWCPRRHLPRDAEDARLVRSSARCGDAQVSASVSLAILSLELRRTR